MHVSRLPSSAAAFIPTLGVVPLWRPRWVVVSPSAWSARRSSGEGAGEPEKGQEHRTFAHVLHAPASRSFSRAAQPSLGDNRRCGHVHENQPNESVIGGTPTKES